MKRSSLYVFVEILVVNPKSEVGISVKKLSRNVWLVGTQRVKCCNACFKCFKHSPPKIWHRP